MTQDTQQTNGDEVVHYRPPRKSRAREETDMQPPLTPMIDVTFQLLLFFLVATNFRVQEGQIPGTLPQSEASGPPPPVHVEPVNVRISPGRAGVKTVYRVGGRTATEPKKLYDLLDAARRAQGGSEELPVLIEPSDNVEWQYIVEAFNQSVRAKFTRIGFVSGGG